MQTAKLFMNGRSQAVRLPAAFRFEGDEVFIRHDESTTDWEDFKALQRTLTEEEKAEAAMLFARSQEDNQPFDRDPFAGWQE